MKQLVLIGWIQRCAQKLAHIPDCRMAAAVVGLHAGIVHLVRTWMVLLE